MSEAETGGEQSQPGEDAPEPQQAIEDENAGAPATDSEEPRAGTEPE